MSKEDIITIGTRISTVTGCDIVTGYNGSIVYLDEYEPDFDNNPDDLIKTGERMLTLYEIGLLMKELDGHNHNVTFESDTDD